MQHQTKTERNNIMKTINVNVKSVNEFNNDNFNKEFKNYIQKVVAGKVGIRLEVGENKKVFNIICNDGRTIYINRNKEIVWKLIGSDRNDYKTTSDRVLSKVYSIYKGYLEEE